jgi:uncharacterized protein (TIGR03083 family)
VTDFTRFSRAEWLSLSDQFYFGLEQSLRSLSPATWDRKTAYLGWSVRDVLAHMASAMPVNFREMLDRALAGHPKPPPEFDTFTRNAHAVMLRRGRPAAQLLDEFCVELTALLATYRALSDADWLRPAWFFVGPVTVRTLFLVQFADHVFHERDVLRAAGRWNGIDGRWGTPLVDWFMREYRIASFRPERAAGLHAIVAYRLRGAAGGDWTMRISGGRCSAGRGLPDRPDVTVEAKVEDLIAAGLARPAPVVGRIARMVDWVRGPSHTEDVVAAITGASSIAVALLGRRIRVLGNRTIARRVNEAFWHFWQRREQTVANIARGTDPLVAASSAAGR